MSKPFAEPSQETLYEAKRNRTRILVKWSIIALSATLIFLVLSIWGVEAYKVPKPEGGIGMFAYTYERHLDKGTVGVLLLLTLASFLTFLGFGISLWLHAKSGAKNKCPHCDRWWGKRVIKSELAGTGTSTEQRTVTDDIRAGGQKIGEVNRKVNVQVSVGYVQMQCHCAWCSSTWSAVGTI